MCGLAGIFSRRNRIDTSVLAQMGHILHHRGPDDAGLLTLQQATGRHRRSKRVDPDDETPVDLGLAFRRLKIIDLSERGAQPMANADESIWLTFNGEIYNYLELREELALRGREFRSASDTEVIIALYEAEGLDAFKRLNGMFAIALWDQRSRRLVLARDRFGVKPLYYATTPDGLVFASEIKALLCHPAVSPGINALALAEHLAFQFPLADRTLFSGVRLLEPGSLLIVEGDKTHRVERFWRLGYRPQSGRSLQSWAADLRERLVHAIRRQVRSDVPVGTFLSGGMDTGSISALAARSINPLHTFTCGFHVLGMNGLEQHFDERQDARDLAARLGTLHHELEVGASDLAALLPAVMWHLEEARVGISYQIYKLSELVRRHVTVVLSGTGGDEMFAGYPWRYNPILVEADPAQFEQRFYDVWCRLTSDAQRSELLSDDVLRSLSGSSPRDGFNAALAETAGLDPLHRAMHFEAGNFLQGVLLVEDRLNMAFSVEARVPLLDNELVDLLETMPSDMKYDGAQTKIVLREALRGILPDEVLTRRKQGFTPPDETWMRTVSRPYIERILLSPQSLDRGLFRSEAVRNILQAHFDGRSNHRFLIWSLLCIEWMQRLFVDGERPRGVAGDSIRSGDLACGVMGTVAELLQQLREFWLTRRAEVDEHWKRTLPLADYIVDRWEKARLLGFGEGTSIYDSSLVLGDVKVGSNTWIGPSTILDGQGGLTIGSYCSISAGVHIYTHHTIRWSLSSGQVPMDKAPTRIGSNCYIGPNTVVTMGVTIGDGCVIGANSLVLASMPAGSKAWGNPCQIVGPARLEDFAPKQDPVAQ